MKAFYAPLEQGVESSIDEDGMRQVGTLTPVVFVYDDGDVVPHYAVPLGELLKTHVDPATGLITLAHHPPATMDPALVKDVPVTAMASLGLCFAYTPKVEDGAQCSYPLARDDVRG